MPGMPSIEFVTATRIADNRAFWETAPLGRSLLRLQRDSRIARPSVTLANTTGLPQLFNARIGAADAAEILVFVHDDAWIDDHFVCDRVLEGLRDFDVVGIAGNRRRVARQPSWCFVDAAFTWDRSENLSGAIAHGTPPAAPVSFYGSAPAPCELLDGVFLAARTSALVKGDVRFDPAFAFHFYDVDFCRTARRAGLRLGTWPIALTHASGGTSRAKEWALAYRRYLDKWGS
jgi:GT2 family glycosyltransferase